MQRGDTDGIINQRGETRSERTQRLEAGEKKLAAILSENAASYEEVELLRNGAKKWLYVTDRPPETSS